MSNTNTFSTRKISKIKHILKCIRNVYKVFVEVKLRIYFRDKKANKGKSLLEVI